MTTENLQPDDNQGVEQFDTFVRRFHRANRPSPYIVQWGRGKKRKTEAYRTLPEREKRYRELLRSRREGREETILSRDQIEEYLMMKRAIGDHSWLDVVASWKNEMSRTGRSLERTTVTDAVKEYLADAEKKWERGELADDTIRHKRQKLNAFAEEFGSKTLVQLVPEEIESWIDDMGWDSPFTFNTYRKHVRALLAENSREIPANPIDQIKKRSETIDHVSILTPQQTAQLFAYALKHYPEALGRLALEAFGGIRFGSATRLTKAEINFAERGILLPRGKIKTRNRRFYLDDLPDNLWLWLAKTNDACWAMENAHWMHLKTRIFNESGVPHPPNCLRHSFATYHVAAYKNPGRTAAILCHQNEKQLWRHYYGIASQAQGLEYFAITPENVDALVLRGTPVPSGHSLPTEITTSCASTPFP